MNAKDTIMTAPEMLNISEAFSKFRLLPGNEAKTRDDFYSLLTAPSVGRDVFLSECKSMPAISENIVRQQFNL